MDPLTLIQPVIGPVIGGGLALVGGYVASKRTDRATRATERRKLSHDSAREITSQLAVAAVIGRRHRDHASLDLTQEGRDELAEVLSKMEHHVKYIDSQVLQDAVTEAIGFLRPPPDFEAYLEKSVPGIIHDLSLWIGPMVQAHVLCDKPPSQCDKPLTEPAFLEKYRDTYQEVAANWEDFIVSAEAAEAEERRKAREVVAQGTSEPGPAADQN